MRSLVLAVALATLLSIGRPAEAQAPVPPPFTGTILIDPDIITSDSPTVFSRARYAGRDRRVVFDRRKDDWVTIRAFVVRLRFSDGTRIDAVVNPEFRTERAAVAQARKYAVVTGRLPAMLRRDVDELWIHRGKQLYGGGNRSLLIHTGQTGEYVRAGILEETLAHEGAHTSLDADLATSPGWVAAQEADPAFISDYARDNPQREDVAETIVSWLAVRYARDSVDPAVVALIEEAIPHRLALLDEQAFDLAPYA